MNRTLLSLLSGFSIVALVGCADEPAPFNPYNLQQIQRQRSADNPVHVLPPLPTTLQTPFTLDKRQVDPAATQALMQPQIPTRDVPQVRLSLREVMHRTAMNNLDARVVGYQTAIDEARELEATARFDPTAIANYQHQKQENTQFQIIAPTTPVTQNIDTLQLGLKQIFSNGAQAELDYNVTRTDIDFPGVNPNPNTQNQAVFQLTQPLLQNYGEDVNRARITIARNDRRISYLDFRAKLEENIAKAEQTYWQLLAAEETVRIQERLLQATIDMGQVLVLRAKGGVDVNDLQLGQTNSRIEALRATLARARGQIVVLSRQLKRLMSDPEFPTAAPTLVLPLDRPVDQPLKFDLREEIDAALANRVDLIQQALRVDSAEVVMRAAKNNLLPVLNLVGSVGVLGTGGSFDDALNSQGKLDFINWSAGLQFEMPIGNRAARAIWQRTLLQRQQAIDQYRLVQEQIGLEVSTAQVDIETAWQQLAASRQSRLAAEVAVRAIEQQQIQGARDALTPTWVQLKLDLLSQQSDAERAEVEALISYNQAVSELERTKGTILRYNNIAMEEVPLPTMAEPSLRKP